MSKAPATKDDVEEIVGRVVGTTVGDALQLIAERFDRQDVVIGGMQTTITGTQATVTGMQTMISGMQATLNRVENKLNAVSDQADDHEGRLKRFESAAA